MRSDERTSAHAPLLIARLMTMLACALTAIGCAQHAPRKQGTPERVGTAPAVPDAAPQIDLAARAPVPLADYFKILRLSGASFNHDESLLAYASNEGGRMDIWVRPVA